MSDLPPYYPGQPSSATLENSRNRAIREGHLTGGPGLAVSRGANGATVSLLPQPKRRAVFSIGGAVVVTEAIPFTDTPVELTLEPPNTTEILGAVTGSMTDAAGMMDLAATTPLVTLQHPGRYLLQYSATVGYASSNATAANLSDAVARLRLKIGGTVRDETATVGTLHAKLCATGLVRDVDMGTIEGEANINPESGTAGQVTFTGELGVTKVAAYNRWTGAKVTIQRAFQVLVILDDTGVPKIATGAPIEDPATAAPTCDPTVGLVVDRSDVETAPGVDPFSSWNDDPELELTDAQLHVIRLS
jgi:hypothetical protein